MLPIPLTPAQIQFRDEVKAWLDEHLVGEFRTSGGIGQASSEDGLEIRARWEKELAAGRWLGLRFPREYGGRGLSLTEQIIFTYECAAARAPYRQSIQGTDLIGPTLVAFGTEAQKQRFLPGILNAEVIWCQGFSEPGAGSDLAGLSTRAERQGSDWVINGQKVWTTFGHHADWIYLLCRTNRDAPKHKGISMLLVPMRQPGVEVRRIRNIAGGSEFCEVYFDGACTEGDLVVGDVHDGWRVAMATLQFERGTGTLPHQMQFERELDDVIAAARTRGLSGSPELRQRLAEAWIGIRILTYTNARILAALAHGDGTLGPEASIAKVYSSEWHQRLCDLRMDVLGPDAMLCSYGESADCAGQQKFLSSRAESIYGGANQIQRNTIGERVLGLPREPR